MSSSTTTKEQDELCKQFFGKKSWDAFAAELNNKHGVKIPKNSIHLTNFQNMANLVLKKKKENPSFSQEHYFHFFNENIEKFINPNHFKVITIDSEVFMQYFGCDFVVWEKNIEKLLKKPNSQTISSFTMDVNAIYNYKLLSAYISNNPFKCPTVYSVKQYFADHKTDFKELLLPPQPTTDANVTVNNNKSRSSAGRSSTTSSSNRNTSVASNSSSSSTNETNELTQEQQTTIISNQKQTISKLEKQVQDLKKQAVKKGNEHNSKISNLNKEVKQLKEQIAKLELQISNNNTLLSLTSMNLLEKKYIEQAKNALLKYFDNEFMELLLSLPSVDDSTGQLLELLMKRSICHAFATAYEYSNTFSSESVVVSSAIQHLESLMIQNELFHKWTPEVDKIILEKFRKHVKEFFECVQLIPKELKIKFDFSNDLKHKRIEGRPTAANKNATTKSTTITNYYCILPTLYSGGHLLCEEGKVIAVVNQ